jgi:hypothetical protein
MPNVRNRLRQLNRQKAKQQNDNNTTNYKENTTNLNTDHTKDTQTNRTKHKLLNTEQRHYQQKIKTNIDTNAITNLSSYIPTSDEIDLLTKGLSFIPDYNTDNTQLTAYRRALLDDINRILFFRNAGPYQKPLLYRKSEWRAPKQNTEDLDKILHAIDNHLLTYSSNNHNITDQTSHNLSTNHDITIKRADKGGSVVIMDTTDYIHKVQTLLSDTATYEPQTADHTKHTLDKVESFIIQITGKNLISHKLSHYLTPHRPTRTPVIYILPKIHKPNNPPRPIISACQSPTSNLAAYFIPLLQPIINLHDTYLKDTKHLLQILHSHPKLSKNTILFTADISSLYTNIPHDECINDIITTINQHKQHIQIELPNNTIIRRLLEFILKDNYFSFINSHYKQTTGIAMGCRAAPQFANIFMHNLEQQIIHKYHDHLTLWRRFIDDIIGIFEGTSEEFIQLTSFSNSIHPNITFNFESSRHQINFLDTTIYKDWTGHLQTTIYRKPTNKNLLLHFSSKHPFHIKTGLIYAQALRYIRIISDEHKLRLELATLRHILLARGYPDRLIMIQINRAKRHTRHSLLFEHKPKPQPTGNKLYLNIPYRQKQINTLNIHWNKTKQLPNVNQTLPPTIQLRHKTGPNLTDKLIRSKLKQLP